MNAENIGLVLLFVLMAYQQVQAMKCQYRIDKDGNKVFYPSSYKKGYIVNNPELINQAPQKLWKLYLFNIKGFNKDIEKIFKDCETTDIPLSRNTVKQNLAKDLSWLDLWLPAIITLIIAISLFLQELPIIGGLILVLLYPHVDNLCLKFKLQDKEKNGNINR